MTEAQYPRRNKGKIQGAQLHFVYPFVGALIICNGGPVGDQSLDLIRSRNANNLPAPSALPEMKGLHLISIGIDIFNPEAGFHVTGLIGHRECDACKRRTLRSQVSSKMRFSALSNRLLNLLLQWSRKSIDI